MPNNIKSALYFNTLGVIAIAEPKEHFSKAPSQEGPQAFGVDSIVELPDTQESEDESDGGKPEESFL